MPRLSDPKNREEFKKYLRMRLGEPLIQVNVSDMQVEIAVDEALKWFEDYHYNGSEHVYWVKTIDNTDISNGYVQVPDDIFAVNNVYAMSLSVFSSMTSVTSGGYQMLLDMAFNMSNGSLANFYVTKMNYELMQQILIGETPIRYNQLSKRVHVDADWNRFRNNGAIVFDAYRSIDPDVYPDIWADPWLIRYATAKLQYQWGFNISKYSGLSLPGNVQFDGTRIMNDAKEEMNKIEEGVLRGFSLPVRDIIS